MALDDGSLPTGATPAPRRRLASVLASLQRADASVGPDIASAGEGGAVGIAGSCFGELEALRREHGQAGRSELHVTHLDDTVYPTAHRVQQFCAAAVGMSALLAADLFEGRGGSPQRVEVDARRAAAQTWAPNFVASSEPFESYQSAGLRQARADSSLRPPTVFFPALLTGSDGGRVNLMLASRRNVIRAAEMLGLGAAELGAIPAKEATATVQDAVDGNGWTGEELEHALQECGGTVGLFRTPEEWAASEQGRALSPLAPVEVLKVGDSPPLPLSANPGRPLSGVKVLDLTHVLAGCVGSRTLAEHGATVLHVRPKLYYENHYGSPEQIDAGFVQDVNFGKLSCNLDLTEPSEKAKFFELVKEADVLTSSYRTAALERLGVTEEELLAARPGLIIVTNTCFGHVGPMAQYAGFEGIAVTVTGVTASEIAAGGAGLGMYANDYMTGYLMAVGAMLALAARAQRGGSYHVHTSLCQSAMWLQRHGLRADRHSPGSIVPLDHFVISSDGMDDIIKAVGDDIVEDVATGTAFGTLHHLAVRTITHMHDCNTHRYLTSRDGSERLLWLGAAGCAEDGPHAGVLRAAERTPRDALAGVAVRGVSLATLPM